MGIGDLSVVRVWTGETGRFGSRHVQKPDKLLPGGRNPASYLSTPGYICDQLDV